MNANPLSGPADSGDALCVVRLLAIDPLGLGGVVIRSAPGPCRDLYLKIIRRHFAAEHPWRRVPLHIDDDRLLGGLDVAASLTAGKPVVASGILAEADGGTILLPMAERMRQGTSAKICAVMDRGEVHIERNGFTRRLNGRFSVIALDEGLGEDEFLNADLADRLAFRVSAESLEDAEPDSPVLSRERIEECRKRCATVSVPDDIMDTLSGVSLALGITSMRGPLLALRTCRVSAALAGRKSVQEEDVALAIRLVLAPRAQQWPEVDSADDEQQEQPPQNDPAESESEPSSHAGELPEDQVLAAVKASIPADMLARLQATADRVRAKGSRSRGGPKAQSRRRGRPLGTRQSAPRSGERLNIGATLKAAAPWQRLRGSNLNPRRSKGPRLKVRPEDFHVTRFKARKETTTIFVVDASGSAAAQRLAEAKGAVELLLAECYVRRDQVAVIAFRGSEAEVILPPTRALARAKRELAALPGGGGTPLAAGIDAARELATDLHRRGQNPVTVMMTDGRANICRDGSPGHERANEEALAASRLFQASGWSIVVVDTANRPRPRARSIADAMGAQYFPLPHAEAAALSGLVREVATPQ